MFDYLERELPAAGFLFGAEPSVADVTIAAVIRNLELARYQVDASRWPKTAAFVARAFALEEFARLRPLEEACCARRRSSSARRLPSSARHSLATRSAARRPARGSCGSRPLDPRFRPSRAATAAARRGGRACGAAARARADP